MPRTARRARARARGSTGSSGGCACAAGSTPSRWPGWRRSRADAPSTRRCSPACAWPTTSPSPESRPGRLDGGEATLPPDVVVGSALAVRPAREELEAGTFDVVAVGLVPAVIVRIVGRLRPHPVPHEIAKVLGLGIPVGRGVLRVQRGGDLPQLHPRPRDAPPRVEPADQVAEMPGVEVDEENEDEGGNQLLEEARPEVAPLPAVVQLQQDAVERHRPRMRSRPWWGI